MSGYGSADKTRMSSILFNSLSSSVQSLLGIGATSKTGSNSVSGAGSPALQPDSGQLSPFAQLMSTMQQLQLSNPAKYEQVMQQIATNLQTAAQTATSQGNTTAATQLNQLATDFTNSAQSGQLPNVQDLAQAVGGGGHHHHHHHVAPASAASNGGSTATSGTSSSSTISQLLAELQSAFQANSSGSGSLNPASIIFSTLNSAGVGGATSS